MKLSSKIIIGVISGILVLALYVNLFMVTPENPFSPEQITKSALSANDLRDSIAQAVSWYQETQEDNGHFQYEYMPFLDRYVADDNMVRQTGSFYSLARVARVDQDQTFALKATLQSAIAYFQENTVPGTSSHRTFRCILSNKNYCELGSSGLVLYGLIDMVTAYPELESEYQDLIEDYKNYLLAMKKPEEGYRNIFFPDRPESEEQAEQESAFANGEAWLALAHYYLYKTDPEIKQYLDNSFTFFQKEYSASARDNNFYLWGMAAIKEIQKFDDNPELVTFAKPYSDWRLEMNAKNRQESFNRCAYLEGIINGYSVIKSSLTPEEQGKYLEEIDFWISHSHELQIQQGETIKVEYDNGDLKYLGLKRPERAIGGFLTDRSEPLQRIDFTQHCLNSYFQKLTDIDDEKL